MMNKIAELAEQHIRESELHLRHIDELMALARQVSLKGAPAAETEALLINVQRDRDRLAQELDGVRRISPKDATEAVKRGESLKGVLETVGLQLEMALAAVFERNEHRAR
jgi:hypothetical protein